MKERYQDSQDTLFCSAFLACLNMLHGNAYKMPTVIKTDVGYRA